ncbi:MAG: mechanosensitive ion channel domain-containing protein, partial [Pseudomonadota bacterium]
MTAPLRAELYLYNALERPKTGPMCWASHSRRILTLSLVLMGLLLAVWSGGMAVAQDAPAAPAASTPPEFTTQSLRAELDRLNSEMEAGDENASDLTEEQAEQLRTSLRTAIDRLEDAARQGAIATQFSNDFETGQVTLSELRAELDVLQSAVNERVPMDSDEALVGEAAMFATEQDLLAKESELRALQAEMEGYRTQTTEIGARLTAAPRELNQARTQLGEVSSNLTALGLAELDRLGEARRKALQAREFALRRQISALEAEIASLPVRQEIVSARRNLAELRADVLGEDILALQELTGQRKVVEARAQAQRARDFAASLQEVHPLLTQMAEENLRLADMLTEMAADEAVTSRQLAAVRGQTANVQNDLTAATELVSLGQLDREAGATLRRLGNQLPQESVIRSDLRDTQRALSRLTRQRVVAQEQLRDLPIGGVDPQDLLIQAREAEPTLPELSDTAQEAVLTLAEQRRDFLRQISANATSRINEVAELQSAQNELAAQSDELRTVLDENLLWVPSVPAIDLGWPTKVVLGSVELLSPGHLATASAVLTQEALRLWPVTLLFVLAFILTWRLRPSLRADIRERAEYVGRVKQDSLWHTPAVIGAGVVMALPWPLLFALLAILFGASDNPDLLVEGLADGFAYLALFAAIIVTWKYWDNDRSLFAAHFKMPRPLRKSVETNLRWFLPVVGTSSFLLATTSNMRGENIYEGFSLAAFIVTALGLSVFAFLILWRIRTRSTPNHAADEPNRYRAPIAVIAIGLPLFAALMAGAGWYDSADDIMLRLFLTIWLILSAYVVYGTVRRAITVSQRQIKYRQAVERREAQLKARLEQQAAEARGEDMPTPPPVDTDAIDVSAMSRQSAQLLKTLVAIGVVGLLWVIWSGLLPALTIFDGFQLGEIGTGDTDPDTGEEILRAITLWTVLQAGVIATITIIAARNLPGFLEIFILDRMGVDAGARYAVVTILGYIIVATGIVVSFQRLGLQWGQLQWILTGLSVGIGFGLQKIIANFVSGLIILFERPIRIGDFVTIGDKSGTVTRIKIRATTLGDLDNREILIPNENLISQEVTNWTLSNSVTRVIVRVGIAYGSDTESAREVMLDVLDANRKILETPPPQVFFLGFGDSSLDFELRF